MTTKHHHATLAAAIWLATATAGWAAPDQIHVIDKTTGETKVVMGRITNTSPSEVTVDLRGGVTDQISVNEIRFIKWDGEPSLMGEAHKSILKGDYAEALNCLRNSNMEDVRRPDLKSDYQYLTLMCEARLALAGSAVPGGGSDPLKDTGRNLIAFLKANPNTYHSYEANELVGDLLVATGNYAGAEPYYLALKQAKWADYRMRAAVAMGRALLAQNKAAEAAKAFDDVINGEGAGDLAELQRLTAKLGKARATAATGQGEQAVKTIQEIISKIDPDNNDLHAQAYNALGYALRKSNKPKEALLAFLHVDLLYSNSPDAHAEALANMTMLFKELYKPDHARRARATLMQRYGASSWANSVR